MNRKASILSEKKFPRTPSRLIKRVPKNWHIKSYKTTSDSFWKIRVSLLSLTAQRDKFITWYIESAVIQHCYYHPNMKTSPSYCFLFSILLCINFIQFYY